MGHHQKTDGEHVQFLGSADMLSADVGFGDMGRNTNCIDTQSAHGLQILHSTDAGDQQNVQLGILDTVSSGGNQIQLVVLAETVVVAGAGNAVTVGDFDHENAALIQSGSHSTNLVRRITVRNSVGTVPQGSINNTNLLHFMLPPSTICRQSFPRQQWRRR